MTSQHLSHAEKIRLFETLRDSSMSFRELHSLFRISKREIAHLMRKELVEEVWGPRNVGVRFRLSRKGKQQLKALRTVTNFTPPNRKPFVGLKRRL
jgi:hypothetical protein